jgi:hypothetical protein
MEETVVFFPPSAVASMCDEVKSIEITREEAGSIESNESFNTNNEEEVPPTKAATPAIETEDLYRNLFLDHVKAIIQKVANKESLRELLRTASPALTEEELMTPTSRAVAFETLCMRIHPENYNAEESTSTAAILLRDVKDFYALCAASLKSSPLTKRRKIAPVASLTGVDEFPQDFCVIDRWSFLDEIKPADTTICEKKLPALVAAHCINARGAIVHGKTTEIFYSTDNLYEEESEANTIVDIFERRGSGARVLDTVEEIKEELMKRGPVVSTSFVLTKGFMSGCKHAGSFLKERVGKQHEMLIVGWKFTTLGEVWLLKPLFGGLTAKKMIRVAFCQFGVDNAVMVPKSSFENEFWQEGPYLSLPFFDAGWRNWSGVAAHVSSESLEGLAMNLGEGLFSAVTNKSRVVICDKKSTAHSRAGTITEVSWDREKNKWKIDIAWKDDTEG